MKLAVTSMLAAALLIGAKTLSFDFGKSKANTDWRIINDGVMGGLSSSSFDVRSKSVLFSGKISLDNNGGFASFRSPFGKYDLSAYNDVEIRYRSTGQPVLIMLENSQRFYEPYYAYSLPVTDGEWVTKKMKLAEFKEIVLSRKTGDTIGNKTKAEIIRIGFLCANKVAGDFEIEIDYLNFE